MQYAYTVRPTMPYGSTGAPELLLADQVPANALSWVALPDSPVLVLIGGPTETAATSVPAITVMDAADPVACATAIAKAGGMLWGDYTIQQAYEHGGELDGECFAEMEDIGGVLEEVTARLAEPGADPYAGYCGCELEDGQWCRGAYVGPARAVEWDWLTGALLSDVPVAG